MISLDQVYLLEQKVESAVEKIQQLQAENDALRNKCLELTNALSSKSEQLSSFENDQDQIEDGIKKALERLTSIENSVLKAAVQVSSTPSVTKPVVTPVETPAKAAPAVPSFDALENAPAPEVEQEPEITEETDPVIEEISVENPDEEISIPVQENVIQKSPIDNFNRALDRTAFADLAFDNPTPTESFESEETFADDENQDGLGFDIF